MAQLGLGGRHVTSTVLPLGEIAVVVGGRTEPCLLVAVRFIIHARLTRRAQPTWHRSRNAPGNGRVRDGSLLK